MYSVAMAGVLLIPQSEASKQFRMWIDEGLSSFFRRLTFTPDGLLLIVPGVCMCMCSCNVHISLCMYIHVCMLSGAYERREGAFNCACRAATASAKVIRHSMSI